MNRYSSLRFAGRYWNPYVEWREQGAWVCILLSCVKEILKLILNKEWAFWKLIVSTVTLKLFYNG